MNRVLIAVIIISFTVTSCAQGKYGVVKSQAYFRESAPGAVAVNEMGNQQYTVDTIYSVFIEAKPGNSPVWKKAWIGKNTYNVLSTIMATPHIAGMKQNADEDVILSASGSNQLIQLNLEKTIAERIPEKYQEQTTSKAILLEGVLKDKIVHLVISSMEPLRGRENQ